MPFQLAPLPYAPAALEPHIDARTMEIHHGKHHNAYVTNLNKAIEGTPLDGKPIEEILKGLDMNNMPVRNNGGGHYNHTLFWNIMGPASGGAPSGELAEAITRGDIYIGQTRFEMVDINRREGGFWPHKHVCRQLAFPPERDPIFGHACGRDIEGIHLWH